VPVWSRRLDKLVDQQGPRVIDNLQEKNKHHPLEKGRGVQKGGQVFGLAEQMGMGLGEQVDPCNLVVVPTFDSGEKEGKKVFAVEEPVGLKQVEDVKDAGVIERSNPTLKHWPPAARQRQTSWLGGGRALSADLSEN